VIQTLSVVLRGCPRHTCSRRCACLVTDSAAQAFSDHYYNTFDSNRAALGSLYQDTYLLSFEVSKVQGAQAIMQKLTSLPFQVRLPDCCPVLGM